MTAFPGQTFNVFRRTPYRPFSRCLRHHACNSLAHGGVTYWECYRSTRSGYRNFLHLVNCNGEHIEEGAWAVVSSEHLQELAKAWGDWIVQGCPSALDCASMRRAALPVNPLGTTSHELARLLGAMKLSDHQILDALDYLGDSGDREPLLREAWKAENNAAPEPDCDPAILEAVQEAAAYVTRRHSSKLRSNA